MDIFPIGLYDGNGGNSTEKFQLQIMYNNDMYNKDKELAKIVDKLNTLKYEKIAEIKYDELIAFVSR